MSQCPTVLVFAGHDPTGGAGLQADAEAIGALGCHAMTVVTALTVQDTRMVYSFEPVAPAILTAQARAVLADIPVAAIKIGMTGSIGTIAAIASVLQEHPDIPVILDPVMAAGGGGTLSRGNLAGAMRTLLVPRSMLITPNSPEVREIVPDATTAQQAAAQLSAEGPAVLLTGGHDPGKTIINSLWVKGQSQGMSQWPRLPHEYHGSGCTLASACAAFLARGHSLEDAVQQAQHYTWHSLKAARPLGHGQQIPRRVPHPSVHPGIEPAGKA